MSLPLVQRNPTQSEVEQLRLVLSTYQDGTGQLAVAGSALTLPGWRDFERAVAAVFGGQAQESKAVHDVLIPDAARIGIHYGVSCKMRRTLRDTDRTGRVTIEVANAAGEFWGNINSRGIDQRDYREYPAEVGAAILEVVDGWHTATSTENGGLVDLTGSCYLVLSWDPQGRYQLHQFDLDMPDPNALTWSFPPPARGSSSRRLVGEDNTGKLIEWYGESGSQLKYYPNVSSALWESETFKLQSLPKGDYGLTNKAEVYFPELWDAAKSG